MKFVPSQINIRNVFGIFFAVAHLVAAFSIVLLNHEGSWGYYFFAIPDFPVILLISLLGNNLNYWGAWATLIVFGTWWWFFLGTLIARIFIRKAKI